MFIKSGQNHLARHSERGKKTRQTEEEVGRQTSGNGQAWSSPSFRGQWRTGKMEETGCEIICDAPVTLAVKGLMMMMMMMMMTKECYRPFCSNTRCTAKKKKKKNENKDRAHKGRLKLRNHTHFSARPVKDRLKFSYHTHCPANNECPYLKK